MEGDVIVSIKDNMIGYIDKKGTFQIENPENINEMYFPICNEAGLMACVTPILHGDSKTGQNSFILPPVSIEDLYNSKAARNFWFYIKRDEPWSATGNSALQNANRFLEGNNTSRTIEAGFLWHKLIYQDNKKCIKSEILNFAPANSDRVEIMFVTLTNIGTTEIEATPTSAIPLYGKSAENIRDHRHVTALVNRLQKHRYGISMRPEIIFDERGHKYNKSNYFVIGCESDGTLPIGTIPTAHSFTGAASGYDWPLAVVKNLSPEDFKDENTDGMEYVGALRFGNTLLKPGEKKEFIILIGTCSDIAKLDEIFERYNSKEKIEKTLIENKEYWSGISENMVFNSGLEGFDNWMRWVGVQPVFRKIYGCSFLPYHDYGKGGRGWRDLWQDCLSLILQNPENVRKILKDNFGGVRIDGTNATIIGTKPGEFIADRNNIARVWMDHGAWPYLTTKMYVDQSSDFSLLMEKQVYFRDVIIMRAAQKDEGWTIEDGQNLKDRNGNIYEGTLMEHLLVQHLTAFYNVGEHNILKLEGADWNDTLDMAKERGESTAFTALYASNLISLSELLLKTGEVLKLTRIEMFNEIEMLLDTLSGIANYESIEYKRTLLNSYLNNVGKGISGNKVLLYINEIAMDLRKKGQWLFKFIRENEWLETKAGDGFFNGYYNNDGQRVDGEFQEGIRMNLTGQVFSTMFGLADENQVSMLHNSVRKYLKDPVTGGFRLNTDLGPNKLNFGRGFAFAYGEKENGSTFCHMAVMYMNALYKRGFVNEAYEVFESLYSLSNDLGKSSIYPGIPEYFSASGKGLYTYLTGSASWLLISVLNEMYGLRGEYGDLVISPKLKMPQFDKDGRAAVTAWFAGKRLQVSFINEGKLDFDDYKIIQAKLNEKDISQYISNDNNIKIKRKVFTEFCTSNTVFMTVILGEK